MRKMAIVGVVAAAALGGVVVAGTQRQAAVTVLALGEKPTAGGSCEAAPITTGAAGGASMSTLTAEQRNIAKVIVDVAREEKVGDFGAQVGVATGLQESGLRNLPNGDRDSVGVFQQRDAWGPFAERTNPRAAAMMFYNGGRGGQPGLKSISGWKSMPLWEAAQSVQQSGFPTAYQQWAGLSAQLVKAGGGGSVVCDDGGDTEHGGAKTEGAISFAEKQLGKPYVWGGTGPDGYDCSGLMLQAWSSVGIRLPRTADQQYGVGKHIPIAQKKRGDLLFWSSDGTQTGIHHVAMYLGGGKMIEAQQDGVPILKSPVRTPELMPQAVRL